MRYYTNSEQDKLEMIPEQVIHVPDSDAIRMIVSQALEPDRKAALGQFMTPSLIAQFMATMFDDPVSPVKLLDAGAGIGSLIIAAVARFGNVGSVDAWEIDPLMQKHLNENLKIFGLDYTVHADDFIKAAVPQIALANGRRYTHAILNPPYKKLNSNSVHRALLRKVGIETVNLYTAFVALSVLLLEPQGQIVAIIPRSFCNGPYYRPFRRLILKNCSLDRIHVFESRTKAFKDDEVLQENVIVKLVRNKQQGSVVVSTSHDQKLTDYSERTFPFSHIVKPSDPEVFIHIPIGQHNPEDGADLFQQSLADIGLEVSTGPVVDFRLGTYWLAEPTHHSIPLLYPHHFSSGKLEYPKHHKKPNALLDSGEVRRWLMPNDWYVLVKRFSSKEERRRVVAYVYDPNDIKADWIGFENHWNVFHSEHRGFDPFLAKGLACFLNSTVLDKYFRVFSGHTQVNATDLRSLKYPRRDVLHAMGINYRDHLAQAEIDALVQSR